MKLAKIILAENENKDKCSPCTLYIVLFSITFLINLGTGISFVYYKYMNHVKETDAKENFNHQTSKNLMIVKILIV